MKNFKFITCVFFLLTGSASFAQDNSIKLNNHYLEKVISDNKKFIETGQVANYIPELTKANKSAIASCIITPEGTIYQAGDVFEKFTIQSISKLISLSLAVEDYGEETVFNKVSYAGTHLPFNNFAHLETEDTPINPMMNAGAIVVSALVKGNEEEAFSRILKRIQYITKNEKIGLNEAVYHSEKETGHRNRGMFHLLKNKGLIDKDETALDVYFKQCSIEINTIDLAKIAYFFANNGTRFDGDTSYKNENISELILAEMLSGGMYDFSGTYARKVGIPSKSGVGGGILASDSRFGYGLAVFNPALDQHGNSAVGYHMLKQISKELKLSIFKK